MGHQRLQALTKGIVLVFDIVSSTRMMETLSAAGRLGPLRKTLEGLERFLEQRQVVDGTLIMEPYKFTGDGWILIFRTDVTGRDLASFMRDLCDTFDDLYRRELRPNLNAPLKTPPGLTFGVDIGELTSVTIFGQPEYVGRVLNVACRLQGEVKAPNEALVTKAVMNDFLRTEPFPSRIEEARLKNIPDSDPWECWRLQIKPLPRPFTGPRAASPPTEKPGINAKARRTVSKDHGWLRSIDTAFAHEVHFVGIKSHEPRINVVGEFSLRPDQSVVAVQERDRLDREKRPNDPHAIVVGTTVWESDPVILSVEHLDFAGVLALRQEGGLPQLLSASAVIVCPESREIVLQERGRDTGPFSGKIHTLGGAYMPPGHGVDPDRRGPRSTIGREVLEEAQLSLPGDVTAPILISKELSTGFIQVVYLGLPVRIGDLSCMAANWEGTPLRIPFDDLPAILGNPLWVPSGKAHVLAWLAMGAPNAGRSPKFGGRGAKQIFDSIVGKTSG